MNKADRFLGAVLVLTVVFAFAAQAMRAVIEHQNVWGVFLAVGSVSCGCMVAASVWRDRL